MIEECDLKSRPLISAFCSFIKECFIGNCQLLIRGKNTKHGLGKVMFCTLAKNGWENYNLHLFTSWKWKKEKIWYDGAHFCWRLGFIAFAWTE
jgi:hypothetical protein